MSVTDKEEAINIQSLMRVKPRFCGHCRVVLISSGIRKFKADLPLTLLTENLVGSFVRFVSPISVLTLVMVTRQSRF